MRHLASARCAPRRELARRSRASSPRCPLRRRPARPLRRRWRPRRRAGRGRRRRRPGAGGAVGSRVRPPSTRRTSTGTVSRTTPTTSATRQAIASNEARAMWAGRVPDVSPAITARASDSHHGAPTPASAGSTRTPPASSTSAAAAASAAGSAASPRSRLSHSSSAPAVNTPPSIAHSTRPSTRQATVGSRPPPGLGPLVARVREHEHAGAVGGLHQAGLDAAGAGERRLLVDAARPQRQLDRPGGVAQRAEIAGRVRDHGQRARPARRRSRAGPDPSRERRAGCATRSRDRSRTRRRAGRRGRSRRCRAAAVPASRACATAVVVLEQPGSLPAEK